MFSINQVHAFSYVIDNDDVIHVIRMHHAPMEDMFYNYVKFLIEIKHDLSMKWQMVVHHSSLYLWS